MPGPSLGLVDTSGVGGATVSSTSARAGRRWSTTSSTAGPIVRYTHAELAAQFPDLELLETRGEERLTPWGTAQQFTAVLVRRRN